MATLIASSSRSQTCVHLNLLDSRNVLDLFTSKNVSELDGHFRTLVLKQRVEDEGFCFALNLNDSNVQPIVKSFSKNKNVT